MYSSMIQSNNCDGDFGENKITFRRLEQIKSIQLLFEVLFRSISFGNGLTISYSGFLIDKALFLN